MLERNNFEQHVTVSENGRIIIPASIRKELNIKSGDELILRLSPNNEIVINSPKQSLQKIQNLIAKKNKTNLVETLIAIRRKEKN